MTQNHTKKFTQVSDEEVEQLIQCLPKATTFIMGNKQLINYQGVWYDDYFLKVVLNIQRHFIAKDTDIFIASLPKTGTTWLKSWLFSIVNRANNPINQTPLLNHNPHELIYGLETHIYADSTLVDYPQPIHLEQFPEPRLLSSHLPYSSLPKSITESNCKIIYIARNPSDTLVSQYYFSLAINKNYVADFQPPSIEDFFQDFYNGEYLFGPYFDHVLSYWNMSLEKPQKVLFLKYEDLKSDSSLYLKRVADFLGMPFSTKEENDGVVKEIIELCSFNKIKELEVNKNGVIYDKLVLGNKSFFRKGEIGDWTNHFTPRMTQMMNDLMHEKLKGTGLSFTFLPRV